MIAGRDAPFPLVDHATGSAEIVEMSGAVTRGPARAVVVFLEPMELRILREPLS